MYRYAGLILAFFLAAAVYAQDFELRGPSREPPQLTIDRSSFETMQEEIDNLVEEADDYTRALVEFEKEFLRHEIRGYFDVSRDTAYDRAESIVSSAHSAERDDQSSTVRELIDRYLERDAKGKYYIEVAKIKGLSAGINMNVTPSKIVIRVVVTEESELHLPEPTSGKRWTTPPRERN